MSRMLQSTSSGSIQVFFGGKFQPFDLARRFVNDCIDMEEYLTWAEQHCLFVTKGLNNSMRRHFVQRGLAAYPHGRQLMLLLLRLKP